MVEVIICLSYLFCSPLLLSVSEKHLSDSKEHFNVLAGRPLIAASPFGEARFSENKKEKREEQKEKLYL